jgi:tetratricopeptide (TPR) repeat protein
MNIINNNPYRIIGILSNSSAKEIQSRKSKITAYANVGKQITSEFDFPFLDNLERNNNNIEKAFAAIQQSQEMLDNSLFWFLKTNSFDDTAITYLINGDIEKAIEIWEKVTLEKEITSKNFSCFNNIGTLKLLGTTPKEIKEGIESKIKLIESKFFTNLVHDVAGEAFVIDNQKQIENFINILLIQLNSKYSNSEILNFFEECSSKIQNYLKIKYTEEPIHKIESAIENSKKKRNQNKINAYKYGVELHNVTRFELENLKSLLGIDNLTFQMISDNLAKEIMQCGIDYFNENDKNNSNESFLENALTLNNLAQKIAIGKLTKDKAKDHIKTLEEMKEKEISQAIEILRFVKNAYEKNETEIYTKVAIQEKSMRYGESINWSKVNELIKNSLNWLKIIELIHEAIPSNHINKIKNCPNQIKLKEYKSLVEFLFDKLSYSDKIRVNYLNFWQTSTNSPISRPTTTTTPDEGIPDWIKIIGGIILFIILIRACN